ncbi:MAG: type III restriction-modification system endonuclease [Candidatus Gracilibacteria bacterium]|nr:type III restriction-modification system endonuclease [Candidatus Gracilibacteria bacterium]
MRSETSALGVQFNFEKNLSHQDNAIKAINGVFEGVEIIKPLGIEREFINPSFDTEFNFKYTNNIGSIQEGNNIERSVKGRDKILDIMMETGTGKTYTYTKSIFELNKNYGIFKFIIVVPTLPIKAGTINFLKSESTRGHFKEQYEKTIELHIVESKKGGKAKKSFMPPAINSFVNAGKFDKNKIQVLIINAGMINSDTMQKTFDVNLLDKYSSPFDAISATKPFMFIDEPHKFANGNKTWTNIMKMNPEFIIRFGATFPEKEIKKKNVLGKIEKIKVKDYYNLIYTLTSVDSFNRNLVKGVIGHISEFDEGKNIYIKFNSSDGKEANFELVSKSGKNHTNKIIKLSKKDNLEKIHPAIENLFIENLNKTTVKLSNGLELKRGDKINPFSYAETLQETMVKKTIKSHFELEKELLTGEVKIKPLTLFFIDNIEEYRNKDGSLKKLVEKYIKSEIKELLKTETNLFYKKYLEKSLEDISKTHGGYFSKDNSDKDEAIEKEVNEILHDKQEMLNLENPRRFIFSKWTLREGWDNPNVFQICKLRSSGSEISKLQEVGRGLRLPVNEYGNRVKDKQFFLNYFVDFTENDFVEKLKDEINSKSGAYSIEHNPEKLEEKMIKDICEKYNFSDENILFQKLIMEEKIIDFSHNFLKGGFDYVKKNFPLIFEGIDSNKIRTSTDKKRKIKIRTEKYSELKELWEKLNQKVILEYKIESEGKFSNLFLDFLKNINSLEQSGVNNKTQKIIIKNNEVDIKEEISIFDEKINTFSTMKYSDFLKQLSKILNINIKTLHNCFINSEININKYLSQSIIRLLKQKFDNYLMYNAIDKFGIEYKKVTNSIHPTVLTNNKGEALKNIDSGNVGVFHSEENVANSYYFEELFYDSELEKENIKTDIKEVTIFTKIPKNSIKIPVSGGKSYSPDFAYVLNYENGKKKIFFVVETKGTSEESLRDEEKQKIKHAEIFFDGAIKVKFEKQFSDKKISTLIKNIIKEN